ncbi:MAG: hypothetical protein IJI67_09335 [Clostridia bacterium]|nr:hypothetical protein [Clostridia bacterium]
MDKRNILFIGGDERQIYCAKKLYDCGYEVSLFGFEKYHDIPQELMIFHNLKIAVILADVIILPTPFIYEESLFAPFSQTKLKKEEVLQYITQEKIIFGGKYDFATQQEFSAKKIEFHDFLENEEVTLQNAYLTAEGTVEKMMAVSKEALFQKSVLIIGFGRIAKCLLRLLSAFKMNITVAARKKSDLTIAKLLGAKSKHIAQLSDLSGYDFIINTVPAKILEKQVCEALEVPLIDLACKNKYKNKNYMIYSSVPGKYAPQSAGEICADFVCEQLGEGKHE